MKKYLFILALLFSSFTPIVKEEITEFVVYQDWTIVYNNSCEQKQVECIDFYYAITRTVNKVYNPQDGYYYYYYYLIVQSNSTYSDGTWAYTKLNNVSFFINNQKVYFEPYVLFREQENICIFWHPTDKNAILDFKWQNISVY